MSAVYDSDLPRGVLKEVLDDDVSLHRPGDGGRWARDLWGLLLHGAGVHSDAVWGCARSGQGQYGLLLGFEEQKLTLWADGSDESLDDRPTAAARLRVAATNGAARRGPVALVLADDWRVPSVPKVRRRGQS